MNEDEQELFESNGWQAINRIGAFAEMHHIFLQNYQDLMNIITKIQNPAGRVDFSLPKKNSVWLTKVNPTREC